MKNLMIISSDGHAAPPMRDYRGYLDPDMRDEFDAFCDSYDELGIGHPAEGGSMRFFVDEDQADNWKQRYIDTGRIQGTWDVERRLKEMEQEGICAEVLIPEFNKPFVFAAAAVLRQLRMPDPTPEQQKASDRAFNRWLADFCSQAPERFAGQAYVHFDDVEFAMTEIRNAKELGLRGVMIPNFDAEVPLFSPRFDPIWSLIEELDLTATSHVAVSLTSDFMYNFSELPHPGCAGPLGRVASLSMCQQVLDHMVWGGVFERHPKLRVVFTEQGSGWVPSKLAQMDYSYDGSYMRQDLKSVIKHMPSEYFERQCWIGSSLLGRTEVENRHVIGVHKMMVGADYPHFEGTWNGGNLDYLQACFGPAQVPETEARMMLGETIAEVYGFDVSVLETGAEQYGPSPERILTPPTEDLFPRGDVGKPFGGFSY